MWSRFDEQYIFPKTSYVENWTPWNVVENVISKKLIYNTIFFPQTSWRTEVWVDEKYSFHRFCGKLNSMELVENIFAVEFGYPVVDEFTLETDFWSYISKMFWWLILLVKNTVCIWLHFREMTFQWWLSQYFKSLPRLSLTLQITGEAKIHMST